MCYLHESNLVRKSPNLCVDLPYYQRQVPHVQNRNVQSNQLDLDNHQQIPLALLILLDFQERSVHTKHQLALKNQKDQCFNNNTTAISIIQSTNPDNGTIKHGIVFINVVITEVNSRFSTTISSLCRIKCNRSSR